MSAADEVLFGGRPPAVVDVTDRALAHTGTGAGASAVTERPVPPPQRTGPPGEIRAGGPASTSPSGSSSPSDALDVLDGAHVLHATDDLSLGLSLGDSGDGGLHVEFDPWHGGAGSGGLRHRRARLVTLATADAAGLIAGWSVGVFAPDPRWHAVHTWPAALAVLVIALPLWWAAIALAGGYPARAAVAASGAPAAVGRLVAAAGRLGAPALVLVVLLRPESAQGAAAAWPIAVAVAALLRLVLSSRRLPGIGPEPGRVLVVGSAAATEAVARRLAAGRRPVLRVVGRCAGERLAGGDAGGAVDGYGVDGADIARRRITAAARAAGADLVLVAEAAGMQPERLRRLAWSLEGTGLGLLVATGLDDVAPGRLRVHLAAGLPLLEVSEPAFTGATRVVKEILDRAGAAVLLAIFAPLMLFVAGAVRLADPGPALFRQSRIGRHGERFTMFKFRSMRLDAERTRALLAEANDHRVPTLFKMRADPRVTVLGRWLRRLSIDELPQLMNVLRGEMSLVGPRPPLPDEVECYETSALRRLRVKPGLTGLWQVSGRSDLNWDQSVRLDLSYVENWSIGLDCRILGRTLLTVIRGTGAR